jgi:kynurenine formamidase
MVRASLGSDDAFPTYRELLARTDAPPGSAWGVFGPDDELGTLNHLTPERVRDGMACVRHGAVINLDLPLDAFSPSLIPTRKPLEHHMFASNDFHRDEYLDSLYTQNASQLDGLRHMGHPDYGFYNGYDPQRFDPGDPFLGVNRMADHGIVGRGVLVDIDRHLRRTGRSIDHDTNEAIGIDVIAEAVDAQGVELRPGDILMLRFGWIDYHLNQIDDQQRARNTNPIRCPGLAPDQATVAWLWDNRFSVVTTDNVAVEAWPAPGTSPFVTDAERSGELPRGSHTGIMHRILIPLLGMVLGELWALDELAEACERDGVYDCMVVSKPLNLTGGAGSPANALAIR